MHVAFIGNDLTPDKLHRRLTYNEVCTWRDAVLADASLLNLLCRWAVEQEEQIAFNAVWILSHLFGVLTPTFQVGGHARVMQGSYKGYSDILRSKETATIVYLQLAPCILPL